MITNMYTKDMANIENMTLTFDSATFDVQRDRTTGYKDPL